MVISRERSVKMLRAFIAATSSSTPISDAITTFRLMMEASIPSKATIAKLLTPTSLFDHSRSIPTSIPTPIATAIFRAMGVAGKRADSICILAMPRKLDVNTELRRQDDG